MKGALIVLSFILAASNRLQTPIAVLDIPSSVRQAFWEEHPSATHVLFQFSTDDAGIFYLLAFTEDGHERIAEYRYGNRDWLQDEGANNLAAGFAERLRVEERDLSFLQFECA